MNLARPRSASSSRCNLEAREKVDRIWSSGCMIPNKGIDCIPLPDRCRMKGVVEYVIAVIPHIPSHLHQLPKPGNGPPLRGATGTNGGKMMELQYLPPGGGKDEQKRAPTDEGLVSEGATGLAWEGMM